MLRAPFSSEFGPTEESESNTDPLGLSPSYERLADRLLPAVTVRMGHPRFVTAIAIGARLLDAWDEDEAAADVTRWRRRQWRLRERASRARSCGALRAARVYQAASTAFDRDSYGIVDSRIRDSDHRKLFRSADVMETGCDYLDAANFPDISRKAEMALRNNPEHKDIGPA